MLALQREARLAFCQWRGILHDPRSGWRSLEDSDPVSVVVASVT